MPVRLLDQAAAPAMPRTTTATASTRQNVSLRRKRRRSTIRSASSDMVVILIQLPPPSNPSFFGLVLVVLFALAFERGAQDVAERRAGIRRAVLGDRLLLLGNLQRLDRD